jgi:peptidoglycan/xylan/chitin deacetylase (PgdA/CDA1 family)
MKTRWFLGIVIALLSLAPMKANSRALARALLDPQSPFDINIPILAYHKIDQTAPTEWYVTADQFARQMDVLQAYGYQTIGLDDYMDYTQGVGQPPEKPIILTFDDGFQGLFDYAAPILKERNMSATFFIITGKVAETDEQRQDNQDWQPYPPEPPAYHLIWPEVASLYQDGFAIESHTVSHLALTGLSSAQQQYQLNQSRQDIQTHLPQNPTRFFAYPYGDGSMDPTVRANVQTAGYSAAVGFSPNDGLANPSISDLWALPRRAIKRDVSLDLNPSDPYWFFMRRVDPNFPAPYISISNFRVKDAANRERTAFYSGEPITVSLKISNWGNPVNDVVMGSLELMQNGETVYDSHTQTPSQDVSLSSLPYGAGVGDLNYSLIAPPSSTISEQVSYTLRIKDHTYLLGFFTSSLLPAFTVQPYPIDVTAAPAPLELYPDQEKDLTFSVSYTGADAEQMYLTVSFSNAITVTNASPGGVWTSYPVGSLVKANGCSTPCMVTVHPIYEASEPLFGGGVKNYSLRLRLLPGVSSGLWLRYRLTMRVPGNLTGDYYLRDPITGNTDQQLFPAFSLPITGPNNLFLPLVQK